MKKLVKVFAIVLLMVGVSCCQNSISNKSKEYKVTETSTLYDLNGGIVSSKMQSKENGNMMYSLNVKYRGNNECVKVTKEEYNSFDLGDTIKIANDVKIDEINVDTNSNEVGWYKVVMIGGEKYLLIKLGNDISINDTSNIR